MTERLIKLLLKNDEIELEKIYMKENWIKDVDINKVYENVSDLDNGAVYSLIGYFYHNGIIFEVNTEKAREYYSKSADKGSMIGLRNMGAFYEYIQCNYEKAIEYYLFSIEKGSIMALIDLAESYLSGKGIAQNFEKAEEYFMFAIEKYADCARLYNTLGNLYMCRNDGKKDIKKAIHYYELSVKKGFLATHQNLAYCYIRGLGVEKDNEKALYHCIMGSRENGLENIVSTDLLKSLSKDKIAKLLCTQFDKISFLEEENKKLREENEELKYRPDGPGYHKAKEEFEYLASKFE